MKLTQTDRKNIVAALRAGKTTTAELSSKYDVTPGHVVSVYREVTGSNLTPFKRLSQADRETIVTELLEKKVTINELGARYGVTPSAISYTFKKRAGKSFQPQTIRNLSSQDRETILTELEAKRATAEEL